MVIRYWVLLLCIIGISIGQILFKSSALTLKNGNSFFHLLIEPKFIFAITLYGITTFAWVWGLAEVPLSRAYLMMSLAFVIVPLLGKVFFGEVLSPHYLIGASLIVAGIIVAVRA